MLLVLLKSPVEFRGIVISFGVSKSGISILFRKPEEKEPDLFSFLSPLSTDVWIYMATAFLAVSIMLFLQAR